MPLLKNRTGLQAPDSGTVAPPAPAAPVVAPSPSPAPSAPAMPSNASLVLPENTLTWTYQIRATGVMEFPWAGRGSYAGALVFAAKVVGGLPVANANQTNMCNDGAFASEVRQAGDVTPAVYGGDPVKRFDLGRIGVIGTAGDFVTIKWY